MLCHATSRCCTANSQGSRVELQGQTLHALDYCKLDKDAASDLLKDKKVVVVGYKKSAIDLAIECAEANQGKYIRVYMISITFHVPVWFSSAVMMIYANQFIFSDDDYWKILVKKSAVVKV